MAWVPLPPSPVGLDGGTPLSAECGTLGWMGYPPGCEQTENITFPHPSDADGKKPLSFINK